MGSLAVPNTLLAVPFELIGFQHIPDSLSGFLIELDLNGVVLAVVCDSVAVLAGGSFWFCLFLNCCIFGNSCLNFFGFFFSFCRFGFYLTGT